MFKVSIVIAILVVVAAGGYFLTQNRMTITFNKPTPTSVAVLPTTTAATPTISTQKPSVTTAQSDEETLKAAVKSGLIAEHGQAAATLNIAVVELDGDYAKGMAGGAAGGAMWFAAKVGGVWKLVWDGNGTIDCSVLTPYPNFPTSMIPECYDSATSKIITR